MHAIVCPINEINRGEYSFCIILAEKIKINIFLLTVFLTQNVLLNVDYKKKCCLQAICKK